MKEIDGRERAAILVPADGLSEYGLDFSNSYRRRLEQAGLFPMRLHPTEKTVAYVRSEILDFIGLHVAHRDDRVGEWLAEREAELGKLPGWLINLAAYLQKRRIPNPWAANPARAVAKPAKRRGRPRKKRSSEAAGLSP